MNNRFGVGEESPRGQYLAWFNTKEEKTSTFGLGSVQVTKQPDGIYVGNMIAQNGIRARRSEKTQLVDYEAIRTCLATVRIMCEVLGSSVHCPKFGAGLGGGDWSVIEKILIEELEQHGISVTVYEFEE